MTRKDFELIAELLLITKPSTSFIIKGDEPIDQWRRTVRAFDTGLAVTSPKFDSARFLKACEYGD